MHIKKSTLVILFLSFVLTINAQGRRGGNIETDVFGATVYTNANGFKATLSDDVFDNLIYKDNKGNSISYSKEIAPQILSAFGNDKYQLMYWFVDTTRRLKDSKEKYWYDVFDNIQYENNNAMKASLSEDVFNNQTYKDSNGNELVFSKDIWKEELAMRNNNRFDVFTSLMDYCRGKKSVKIKNKTDIFGNTQHSVKDGENSYESSIGKDIFGNLQYKENNFEASVETNVFKDKIYKDNNGNKITYTKKYIDALNKQRIEFEDNKQLLNRLVRFCKNKNNYKEEYSIDVFGDLQYQENNFKASIETNVFDDKVYKDSNNNQIKYSKEFIDIVNKQGYGFENDNQLLNRLLQFCKDKKNYKEEYSVDIFGDINFKQNNGQTIKTNPKEYRYAR